MILRATQLCHLSLFLLLIGCGPRERTGEAADRPPNVIFVLADDLGYGDLGAYGQERIQTPNLDRMAQEGLRFTDFYAGSTVCAPSRSVLMTGRHTGHTSVRGNSYGLEQTLKKSDYIVSEMLQDGGYATSLIGKWGLGKPEYGHLPTEEGFDYFFGYADQTHAHNFYPEFLFQNTDMVRLENEVVRRPPRPHGFRGGYATKRVDYSHDLFMEEALEWVDEHSEEPFFLYLALTIPHANNEARFSDEHHGMEVPDYGQYADEEWPEPQKGLAAMITRMDEGVGSLLDRIRELGLEENTLVLFSSDNGPHAEGENDPDFFNSNGPLRGIKRDLYEGGIRVPMIAWGPGLIPAGRVTDHVGYFGDFLPTAAELARTTAPDGHDGISLVPVLTGNEEAQARHDYLYWEFYEQGSAQAVRTNSWKAVRQPMLTGPIELYDLSVDLGETNNVADEHPDIVREMERIMDEAHVPDHRWTLR